MDFYKGDFEGLIEFSSAVAENPFGTELLRLVEDNYDSIDEAVEDITDGLIQAGFDVDEEIVVGLMIGEQLPTEDLLDTLDELCATETDSNRLIASAEASYALANEILDAIENGDVDAEEDEDHDNDEEEDEEDERTVGYYEDEDEDDDSDAVEELQEQFSRYAQAVDRISEKEAVTSYLNDLTGVASDLVESGHMPPAAYHLLFGQDESNQYVEFSSACEESETSAAERLSNIEFALAVFEALGPSFEFSSALEGEDYDGYSESEINSLASQIEASYEMYKDSL